MISPATTTIQGWIGSTFDTQVTLYPYIDNVYYTWVGSWQLNVNYSLGNVAMGTDGQAYETIKANVNISPVGDSTGSWSTPVTPLNINGYTGWFEISPVATWEGATPVLATPVQIQGTQGLVNVKFTPAQSTTPLIAPGTYHHFLALTDTQSNTYYYINGPFIWSSP